MRLASPWLTMAAAVFTGACWDQPPTEPDEPAPLERFYQRFTAGADPARALAEAQRALLTAPATAHPFYWAGFVTVGGAERRGS